MRLTRNTWRVIQLPNGAISNHYRPVRFRHRQPVPEQSRRSALVERQEAILAILDRADDGLTLREIRAQLIPQATERQVRRALAALRARSTGRGPAAQWRRIHGR